MPYIIIKNDLPGGFYMTANNQVKVIVTNQPTNEQAQQKTKELCEFLSKIWFLTLKT